MQYLYVAVVALIALTHMIAPDHWLPLISLKAKRNYSRSRTTSLSAAIGILHGVSTSALSALIVFAGTLYLSVLLLRAASVALLIVVALYISVSAFIKKVGIAEIQQASLFASIIPDPALVPIFLTSASFGLAFTGVLIAVFVVVTTLTIIAVVYLTSLGMLAILKRIAPEMMEYTISAMLLLVAAYVLLS